MTVFSHHDYETTMSKYAMENDNWLVPDSCILPDNYRINATALFGLHSSVPDSGNSTLLGNDAGSLWRGRRARCAASAPAETAGFGIDGCRFIIGGLARTPPPGLRLF